MKVTIEKDEEEVTVEVKSSSDIDQQTRKPKTKKVIVWLVHLQIPRRFVDELDTDDLTLYDEDVDTDDIEDAQQEDIDNETGVIEDEGIDDSDMAQEEAIEDDLEL